MALRTKPSTFNNSSPLLHYLNRSSCSLMGADLHQNQGPSEMTFPRETTPAFHTGTIRIHPDPSATFSGEGQTRGATYYRPTAVPNSVGTDRTDRRSRPLCLFPVENVQALTTHQQDLISHSIETLVSTKACRGEDNTSSSRPSTTPNTIRSFGGPRMCMATSGDTPIRPSTMDAACVPTATYQTFGAGPDAAAAPWIQSENGIAADWRRRHVAALAHGSRMRVCAPCNDPPQTGFLYKN